MYYILEQFSPGTIPKIVFLLVKYFEMTKIAPIKKENLDLKSLTSVDHHAKWEALREEIDDGVK